MDPGSALRLAGMTRRVGWIPLPVTRTSNRRDRCGLVGHRNCPLAI